MLVKNLTEIKQASLDASTYNIVGLYSNAKFSAAVMGMRSVPDH